MPLYYSLSDNPMTPNPRDYVAKTQVNNSLSMEDIFDLMTSRGSTITKAEGLAVMEEFFNAVGQAVKNGSSIKTPLFNILPSISGVFNSPEDRFDPLRHQVRVRINPGKRLKEMEPEIVVNKIPAQKRKPVLLNYIDVKTGRTNEEITPGQAANITGDLLKFNEQDPEQGVFFINTLTREVFKLPGNLMQNRAKELIFMNPELPSGEYTVEVRTIIGRNKGLCTGVLAGLLVTKH